jgi:hypothetical protein
MVAVHVVDGVVSFPVTYQMPEALCT